MSNVEVVYEPKPQFEGRGRGRMQCTVRFLKDGKEVGNTHSIDNDGAKAAREQKRVR